VMNMSVISVDFVFVESIHMIMRNLEAANPPQPHLSMVQLVVGLYLEASCQLDQVGFEQYVAKTMIPSSTLHLFLQGFCHRLIQRTTSEERRSWRLVDCFVPEYRFRLTVCLVSHVVSHSRLSLFVFADNLVVHES
jgi:hypothetical protein